MALQVREAQTLRQSLAEKGYEAALRFGDADDPIPAQFEVRDGHGNRVDLRVGLRGMDPELMNRTRQVRLADVVLEIVGGEDFIAMKAFVCGPVDLADARSSELPGSAARPRYQIRKARWAGEPLADGGRIFDRLCAVSGVRWRALQKLMMARYGQSPLEWAHARRLAAARSHRAEREDPQA